ncbi:MAG TPA: hypothetical protein VJI68_01505 [Candidatus Nanoarchaeia archaeon]|nr:hypothetical protein [Candidatus Nanoarchaeia archaeon]
MKNKFYYKEKRVSCKKCGKYFRNRYVYAGHSKIHDKRALEKIANSRLGNLNPAKRLEVRKKISLAGIGRIPWNKNKKWTKDKRHNKIVEKTANKIKNDNITVITTHNYVPDAIIIDFKKRIIKAFELNPGSVISKGLRAKEKGYDFLIVKIRRNPKYCHKNTDKEIPIKEFYNL